MLDKSETARAVATAEPNTQNRGKDRGRTTSSVTRTERPQTRSLTPPGDQFGPDVELQRDSNYDLVQPSSEDWEQQSKEVIEKYYAQAESDFFRIVNDYLDQGNLAAERYKIYFAGHARWRFWTIIATGGLAVINVCAAFDLLQIPLSSSVKLPAVLNAIAALYAGALTVAGNVENFFNKGEKAAGFRESRDLLLNRYREYCFKWLYYVEAHGKTAKACVNAGRLYRQLVDADQELRQKLKQLTEVQGRGPGETGGKVIAAARG